MGSEAPRSRGVYVTPPPLVSFVMRSAHLLLQCKLGLDDGLADGRVRVLDPAAGALNFVVEAWRVALDHHRETRERGRSRFVREHLLPHFHGIELRQEACEEGQRAAAEFFAGEGLPLGPDERVSLQHADALSAPLLTLSDGIPVVIGNPPWSGFRTHKGRWIRDLLHGYVLPGGQWEGGYYRVGGERLEERNTKWLQDDYVKFLRLAQWLVDQAGKGVVALVLNHNFLDAPTFAGLRASVARSFEQVYALNLHGNRRRGERTPKGGKDENVFPGVSQGTAVLFLVKRMGNRRRLLRADLYGTREEKLSKLSGSTFVGLPWVQVPTSLPTPAEACGPLNREAEYRQGTPLPEIFPLYSLGVVTGRDSSLVALEPGELGERYPGRENDIVPFLVRPFDRRFLLYSAELLARPRRRVMSNLRKEGNVALLALRHTGCQGPGALVTGLLPGHKVLTGYDPNSVFPLYCISRSGEREPNLAPAFRSCLGDLLGELPAPEAILGYVYAVLYQPAYRARFHREIGAGFPRIPWPASPAHFDALAQLGGRLVNLHCFQAVSVTAPICGRVEPEVWSYRIGGYQVLAQWSKARAGRRLTPAENLDRGRIVAALEQTLLIQRRLDEIAD